jgi:hypothetical protein
MDHTMQMEVSTSFERGLPRPLFMPGQDVARRARGARPTSRQRGDRSPVDILAEQFPVVRRLAGGESFAAVARRFLATHGYATLDMAGLQAFPDFLRSCGREASFEYVADIAALESARAKASAAAPAAPLDDAVLAAGLAGDPARLRLVLHPSVSLLRSRFPVVSIWELNRARRGGVWIERWGGEAVLVARPFQQVEVRRLAPGMHIFLCALSDGQSVAMAAAAGAQVAADFDLAAGLAFLRDARMVVGLRASA